MSLYRRLLTTTPSSRTVYGYMFINDTLYTKYPNSIPVNHNTIGSCSTFLEARNLLANYVNDDLIAYPFFYNPASNVDLVTAFRAIFPNIQDFPSNSTGQYVLPTDDDSSKKYCVSLYNNTSSNTFNIGLISNFDGSNYSLTYRSVISHNTELGVETGTNHSYIRIGFMVYPSSCIQNGEYMQTTGDVQYWWINISFFNLGESSQSISISNGAIIFVPGPGYYMEYITQPTIDTTYSAVINQSVEGYTPPSTSTDIADCTVVLDSSYQFTGSAIVPSNIYVYDGTTQLTENVDYTVGVTNNTYVGQANVNIAGIGNYTGTQQVHFNITRRNINEATISLSPSTYTYDGTEKEPTVTATFGSYTLQRSVDYTVVYSNNINPGTATVTLNTASLVELDTGNFTGSTTATFTITGDNTPYDPGGTTVPETGPTDGTWTLENDILNDDHSPYEDLGAQLYRIYVMDKNQLSNFSKTLWRSDILTALKNFLSSPLDAIISLGSFPFILNSSSTAETIEFNWIDEWIPSGWLNIPTGYPLLTEYQTLTFGTITVPRYSGTFYDYQPYSQAQLYIPYHGFVEVKINEILGKTMELKYHVNVVTGDFTAVVKLTGNIAPQILGQYQGNMLRQLPLSSSGFVEFIGNSLKAAAIVATAGIAAHTGTAAVASSLVNTATNQLDDADVQSSMGDFKYAGELRKEAHRNQEAAKSLTSKTIKRLGIAAGASAIAAVTASNNPIQRNGNIDPVSGRTSTQEAYLMLSLPHQNIPSNQQILGYPTNLAGPLVNYSGYTEVRDIRLKSGKATYTELAEIEEIVRGGIVI